MGLSRSIKFTESYLDRTLPDSETTRDSETAIPNYDSETIPCDSETMSRDSETTIRKLCRTIRKLYRPIRKLYD